MNTFLAEMLRGYIKDGSQAPVVAELIDIDDAAGSRAAGTARGLIRNDLHRV